jgi:hypothetical protein
MNNQVFLVLAILFIVMILVDIIFNFTGILQENFDVFSNETYLEAVENSQNNNNNNNSPTDLTETHKINSVISHSVGTVYAVVPLGQRLPTTRVLFLIKKNVALSIDSAGKILKKLPNKFDQTQQFRLVKINSDADISNVITNGVFIATENAEYPFYFLQSVKNPDYFITQVSENEITLENGKNSKRQRFDVSHEELLPVVSDNNRKDKTVKIQLKLDENSLERILNELRADEPPENNVNNNGTYKEFNSFADVSANDMNNNYTIQETEDGEPARCDIEDYIPKDAISSLCGNCNPDLL